MTGRNTKQFVILNGIGVSAGLLLHQFGYRPQGIIGDALDSFAHVIVWMVIAVLLNSTISIAWPHVGTIRAIRISFVGAVLLGIAGELLQNVTGGHVSVSDVFFDSAGAASGLLLQWALSTRTLLQRCRIAAVVLAVGIVAAALAAPVRDITATVQRNDAFPVLFDPSQPWSRRLAGVGSSARFTSSFGHAHDTVCEVQFQPGKSHPLFIADFLYPDWRGYNEFHTRIYSAESKPVKVWLRMYDNRHDGTVEDRFEEQIVLRPGATRVRVPLESVRCAARNRQINLARLQAVVFFADSQQPSFTLRFAKMELAR